MIEYLTDAIDAFHPASCTNISAVGQCCYCVAVVCEYFTDVMSTISALQAVFASAATAAAAVLSVGVPSSRWCVSTSLLQLQPVYKSCCYCCCCLPACRSGQQQLVLECSTDVVSTNRTTRFDQHKPASKSAATAVAAALSPGLGRSSWFVSTLLLGAESCRTPWQSCRH
jgi:hypothetical protein